MDGFLDELVMVIVSPKTMYAPTEVSKHECDYQPFDALRRANENRNAAWLKR